MSGDLGVQQSRDQPAERAVTASSPIVVLMDICAVGEPPDVGDLRTPGYDSRNRGGGQWRIVAAQNADRPAETFLKLFASKALLH